MLAGGTLNEAATGKKGERLSRLPIPGHDDVTVIRFALLPSSPALGAPRGCGDGACLLRYFNHEKRKNVAGMLLKVSNFNVSSGLKSASVFPLKV